MITFFLFIKKLFFYVTLIYISIITFTTPFSFNPVVSLKYIINILFIQNIHLKTFTWVDAVYTVGTVYDKGYFNRACGETKATCTAGTV